MNAQDFMHILIRVEPVLFFIALLIFLKSGSYRKLPALFCYLAFRFLSATYLISVIQLIRLHRLNAILGYNLYLIGYWIAFLISTALVFAVIHEMFKASMDPLEGLKRLGAIAFRWACGISVVVAVASSISPVMHTSELFMVLASQLERCESILTLCLLAFLCLASHSLGLSVRSRVFGVSMGLGIMASADLIFSAFFTSSAGLASTANVVYGFASIAGIAVWSLYFAIPEPQRQAIALPVVSPLLRWNEIAKALGHSGGRVLVGQPSPALLSDVERTVELSMARSALKVAS